MAISKNKKKEILTDLKEKISRQKTMLLVGIAGLKVKDISDLRDKIKTVEGDLKVAKKTLMEKALKESDFNFDKKSQKDETALVFSFADEIAPVKAVYQFSQENENLKILGGFIEGEKEMAEAEKIIALAQLPGREELLAKLTGSLIAPVSGLVSVLSGNIKGLVQVLARAKTQ